MSARLVNVDGVDMVEVVMSGAAFRAAFDPLATDWEADGGPAPVASVRRGKGVQHRYLLTLRQAYRAMVRAGDCAECRFASARDNGYWDRAAAAVDRREGDALLKVARELGAVLVGVY